MPRPPRPRWRLYILRCADGSLYTGITNALAERVAAHAAGKGGKYTRARRPVELVWSRRCRDTREARRLEPAVKRLPPPLPPSRRFVLLRR